MDRLYMKFRGWPFLLFKIFIVWYGAICQITVLKKRHSSDECMVHLNLSLIDFNIIYYHVAKIFD